MVPLAPHLRLVEDDASYISLQGIYEDHCRKVGISKDEPVLFAMKKVITALETGSKPLDPNIKLEIFYAIQREKVPSNLALSVRILYFFYF
jgi:transformation/transcription domain-associated protein